MASPTVSLAPYQAYPDASFLSVDNMQHSRSPTAHYPAQMPVSIPMAMHTHMPAAHDHPSTPSCNDVHTPTPTKARARRLGSFGASAGLGLGQVDLALDFSSGPASASGAHGERVPSSATEVDFMMGAQGHPPPLGIGIGYAHGQTVTPARRSLKSGLASGAHAAQSTNSVAASAANATPARAPPLFDPSSPFVSVPPMSADTRLRARLFGQGLDGGYLVSPMGDAVQGARIASSPIAAAAGSGGGRLGSGGGGNNGSSNHGSSMPTSEGEGRTTPRSFVLGRSDDRRRPSGGYAHSPVRVVGHDADPDADADADGHAGMSSPWMGAGGGGMGLGMGMGMLGMGVGVGMGGMISGAGTGADTSYPLAIHMDGSQATSYPSDYGSMGGTMVTYSLTPVDDAQEQTPDEVDPSSMAYIGSNAASLAYAPSPSKYPPSLSARARPPPLAQTVAAIATTPTRNANGTPQAWSHPASPVAATPMASASTTPGSAPPWSVQRPAAAGQRTPSSAHKRNVTMHGPIAAMVTSPSPSHHQRSASASASTSTLAPAAPLGMPTTQIPMQGTKRLRQVSGMPPMTHSPLGSSRPLQRQPSDNPTRRSRPMAGRSVSTLSSTSSNPGMSPAMPALPFTTRPLVHQLHRNISSSSSVTTATSASSWNYPGSPAMYLPPGAYGANAGYAPRIPPYMATDYYAPPPQSRMSSYQGHSRQVSNASGLLDTPQLEHSLQGSPDMSGRSPVGTPQLGVDGQPLGNTYYPSPVESEFTFSQGINQRMVGLAVSGHQPQHLPMQPDITAKFGQTQYDAQVYAPRSFQYQAYAPGAMYQWQPGPDMAQNAHLQRHVSASYLAEPSRPATTNQLRAVSTSASQHNTYDRGPSPLPPSSQESSASYTIYSTDASFQFVQPVLLQEPKMSRPAPLSEEGQDAPPAKRQKTKFPPVGKRLKPGPKPKPKTPKKGQASTDSAASSQCGGTPSLDPFLMSGHNSGQANTRATSEIPGSQTDDDLVKLESCMAMVPSAVPRAVLETLYDSFSVQDEASGAQVKRYRCNIDDCGREFPRKSAIHSHIQTHLEDKPFMCTEPECHAAFVRQHDLRRHVRIHSGNKPFPCPCGKGFARGDALMRHRQRGICSGSTVPMRKLV